MNTIAYELFLLWILFASVIALVLCGYDKACAKLGRWRVPEKVLLTWAMVGGGFGLGAGMLLFRHKTNHKNFKVVGILSCVTYLALLAVAIEIVG